jgi:hypothetical protein
MPGNIRPRAERIPLVGGASKPAAAWPRLADLRDADALCASVLDKLLRSTGTDWPWAEREEKLQDLRLECWRLYETRWDPARGLPFASYASWKLRCWAIDTFFRAGLGRKGARVAPLESFEQLAESGELEWALATGPGDSLEDRALARLGLVADRDRAVLHAESDVERIARTTKGISRLLKELREEIRAQTAA